MKQRDPFFLLTWHGLGDCIYMRPVANALSRRHELWMSTPWPELFTDLDVRFVETKSRYRTQKKNLARQPRDRWSELPERWKWTSGYIDWAQKRSIPDMVCDSFGISGDPAATFDLPDFGARPIVVSDPIAVVRPACVRKEWQNEARNPSPEYIARATELLQRAGYYVVSVADTEDGQEWIVPPSPPADLTLHQGELDVTRLMALVQHASVVVGGVGWIVPACAALRTPLIVLAGGNGGYNSPARVLGAGMNVDGIRWIMPDRYCMCEEMIHTCPLTVTDFDRQFTDALSELEPMRRAA